MRKTFRKYCALGIAALALGLLSAPASATYCDFITGGGFGIVVALIGAGPNEPAKKNFGAHGGCKNSGPDAPFWGHVNYVDHAFSPPGHFKSLTITAYIVGETRGTERDPKRRGTRTICGTGEIVQPERIPLVDFRVTMTDNGEPGTTDRFEITLELPGALVPFYHAEFTFEGGNIQLHKPNPGAAGLSGGGTCNVEDPT
jgi:hypothetical protein